MPTNTLLGKVLDPPVHIVRNGATWALGNFTSRQIANCIAHGRALGEPVTVVIRYEHASLFAGETVLAPPTRRGRRREDRA